MRLPVPQVSLAVLLELIPIDNDGARGTRTRRVGGGRPIGVGIGIPNRQDQSLAVGGPFMAAYAPLDVGQFLRLTALTIEQENLRAALRRDTARRRVGDVLPVGAESRRPLALMRVGEAECLRAVPARDMEIRLAAVANRVQLRHRVEDPFSVGGDLQVAHGADAIHVRQVQRPLAARRGCGRGGATPSTASLGGYVRRVEQQKNSRAGDYCGGSRAHTHAIEGLPQFDARDRLGAEAGGAVCDFAFSLGRYAFSAPGLPFSTTQVAAVCTGAPAVRTYGTVR